MEVKPRIGLAQAQSVFQCQRYRFRLQSFSQFPPQYFSAKEIQNDCQVKPPFQGCHIGDIADPDLIRNAHFQPLYQVGCYCFSCQGSPWPECPLAPGHQLMIPHQACDAILATAHPLLPKHCGNARAAVATFMLSVKAPDLLYELAVSPGC